MPRRLANGVEKEPITLNVRTETADRLRLAAAVARNENGKRLTMGEIVDELVERHLAAPPATATSKAAP